MTPSNSTSKLSCPHNAGKNFLTAFALSAEPCSALFSTTLFVLLCLCVGKIRQFGCHSFILSVCLLPWHLPLSAHYFHSAFSRATKLFPLAIVVFYYLVIFWKNRTEEKATNIPKHKKTSAFCQILSTAIKTLFYKEHKI